MTRICVVGSLNFDMVTTTGRVPKMGETVSGLGFATFSGGKGANQAVAAARLGGEVVMIGCVGRDAFGQTLVKSLEKDGVDTACVKTLPGVLTGSATIVVCGGDNFIILEKGANGKVTPEIADEYAGVILSSALVLLQNEIPPETNEHIIKKFGGRVKILYNPAPSGAMKTELLAGVDILVVNEHECGDILGCEISNKDEAKTGVKKLRGLGAKTVIVTLGKNGSVYNDGDDILEIGALKVAAKDTTAAGDSFCGAVALVTAAGGTVREAVRYATFVSALTVTKEGAQASLPTKEETGRFMNERLGL